jgi:hypothetical protein
MTRFTIEIDETSAGGVHAVIRCAKCRSVVFPREGIYSLRLAVAPDGESVRGVVEGQDGRSWAFASGTELANIVTSSGHTHTEDGD